MSPLRPDLVGCWVFRVAEAGEAEILLVHRAPDRIYPGIWQCVTGSIEEGERVVDGALRELEEETGIGRADIEMLYGLDQVNVFHAEPADAVLVEAVFAARVRPGVEPRLSHEHDDARWVSPAGAREAVVWPAYRTAIDQIEWLVAHPHQAAYLRAGDWATDSGTVGPASG
ncbi:MAG TPA: NUDIX domain-containing protein [Candidatus Binatia bacterium]|nr:NUDIX domain-containing protein [Candidatus Binatia bacterium]